MKAERNLLRGETCGLSLTNFIGSSAGRMIGKSEEKSIIVADKFGRTSE